MTKTKRKATEGRSGRKKKEKEKRVEHVRG